MATVANLLVEIKTRSAGLRRGLNSASKRVGKFVKSVGKKLALLTGIVAAAVTAGAFKMAAMISRVGEQIDKLAKTSTKLGLAVSELQKLQFQAKLTGVSAETLNMALQRMVRRIAEAALGTGEAVKALKELGIDAKALNRLSPDKQFAKIAQAFKGVKIQADKVRLSMKLFDSEGVALVNTLTSGLRETGAEFEALGLGISDQQAKAVEAFNDSQTKLSAVWDNMKQKITASVAPSFDLIINKVLEVVKNMGGLDRVASNVAISIVSGVMSMIKAFSFLKRIIDSVILGLKTIASTVGVLESFLKAKSTIPTPSTIFGGGQRVSKSQLSQDLSADKAGLVTAVDKFHQDSNTPTMRALQGILDELKGQKTKLEAVKATQKPIFGGGTSANPSIIRSPGSRKGIPIDVRITVDRNALIKATVNNPEFNDSIRTQVFESTKDAARFTNQ